MRSLLKIVNEKETFALSKKLVVVIDNNEHIHSSNISWNWVSYEWNFREIPTDSWDVMNAIKTHISRDAWK